MSSRSILTQLQKRAPSRLTIPNVQGQVSTRLDLRSAIQSQIAKSDEVVVLWTEDGAASSFVNYEAVMRNRGSCRSGPKVVGSAALLGQTGEANLRVRDDLDDRICRPPDLKELLVALARLRRIASRFVQLAQPVVGDDPCLLPFGPQFVSAEQFLVAGDRVVQPAKADADNGQ